MSASILSFSPSENPQIDSKIVRLVGAGTLTVAAGGRSVTIVVLAGSPTLSIGGDPAVTLVAGMSPTWAVDYGRVGGETLQDAFVVTGTATSDVIMTSTREV